MKKDYEEMQEYWGEFYEKWEENLREDELGLDLVCCPGDSPQKNKFTDWLQNRTFQKLLNKCGALESKKALDIGTGAGRWAVRLLEKGCKVTAVDSNERMVERNRKLFQEIDFRKMLVTNLDFEDNYFDLVTSVTVLNHIPYERQKDAVKEIVRVTREGKYILILESTRANTKSSTLFANSPAKWIELFGDNGCKKISWLGYEYIPLLLAVIYVRTAGKLLAPSKHKQNISLSKSKLPNAKEGNVRSYLRDIARKGLIGLSYPLEIFCQQIVPHYFARQAGILFQKDISGSNR